MNMRCLTPARGSLTPRNRVPNAQHTEALFGRCVVLVERASEEACLPRYADAIGLNLDALVVSIVNARGKGSPESPLHLYRWLGLPAALPPGCRYAVVPHRTRPRQDEGSNGSRPMNTTNTAPKTNGTLRPLTPEEIGALVRTVRTMQGWGRRRVSVFFAVHPHAPGRP